MRCIFQGIVQFIKFPTLDFSDFFSDVYQTISQSIQFIQWFALCWFNHQYSRKWKSLSGSMEPKVHQSFAYVLLGNSCLFFDLSNVDDKLMSLVSILIRKQNGIMILKFFPQIIGIQVSLVCMLQHIFSTNSPKIQKGNRQNTGATEYSIAYGFSLSLYWTIFVEGIWNLIFLI